MSTVQPPRKDSLILSGCDGSGSCHVSSQMPWAQLIATVSLRIRQSLELSEILQITASEVHQILSCDRVLLYPCKPDRSGSIVAEAISAPHWSLQSSFIHDTGFEPNWLAPSSEGQVCAIEDIATTDLTPRQQDILTRLQVKSALVIPILEGEHLWGWLIAHHCQAIRRWTAPEIEGLQQIAPQVGIAIHQAVLIAQLQVAKTQLEAKYRATETELQASQLRFQSFMAHAPILTWIVNAEGVVEYANSAWLGFLGLTEQSALGQSLHDLFPAEFAQEYYRNNQQVQATAQVLETLENAISTAGEEHTFLVRKFPIYQDQQVIAVGGIAIDITKRQQAETALSEQAKILRIFYETAPLLMGVVETTDTDILHTLHNQTTLAFFGATPETLDHQWASDLGVPAEHIQLWLSHYRQSQQRQQPVQFAYEHVTPTDTHWLSVIVSFIDMAESGRPQFSYIVQDITERKRLEAERQRANAIQVRADQISGELKLLENILEIILAGYWDWDLRADQEYLSPGFKRMFGYQDHELPNSPNTWQELIFPEDLPGVFECFDRHVRSHGQEPYYSEVRYRHKDGSTVWVICSGQVIEWDDSGNPLRMIGCHIDISDLKRTETTLRQSEATNRALVNAIPDFLVRMRQDGLQIEVINQGLVHCLYAADQETPIDGHSVFDVMPAEVAQERVELAQRAIATGQPQRQEYAFVDQGQTYYEEARITPLWNDEVLVVVRDISSRKQIEAQLLALSTRLELAIQSAQIGIWDWDVVNDHLVWDDRLYEMYGIIPTHGAATYPFWEACVHPDDLAASRAAIQQALAGAKEFDTEFRVVWPDGSLHFIKAFAIVQRDPAGQPQRMIGINFDISDRKQIELDHQAAKDQLSSVLNSSLDGIMAFRSLRDDQGTIIDFEWLVSNPTACEIVGYSAHELIGQRLLETLPGNREKGLFDLYGQVVETGKPIQRQFHYDHDGIESWFENIAVKLGDGFVVTFRDITAKKQSEIALQQLNRQLKESVEHLQQRHQEMSLLSEMSDFLQACVTVEEACAAIASMATALFPNCSGGIFIIKASRNRLENISFWGDRLLSQPDFHPQDCWSLRRGRPHAASPDLTGLQCRHLADDRLSAHTLCIPMVAQGETLGLFYLATETPTALSDAKQQLGRTVAEQVALAIANLNLRETLLHQSIRDPLTGLFNRRYLEESLQQEIARAQRRQHPIGIIMIDVDHFKRFNDTFGHDAGDSVLQAVGRLLKEKVRDSDIACRYGGEEMTLVLPESSLSATEARAEELRQAISQLSLKHNHQPLDTLTASLGIACFPQHGPTGNAVLQAADAALYRAKAAGRNQVVIAPSTQTSPEP